VFDAENEHTYAAEVYLKLDDISALMALHIRQQDWDAAVKLSEEHAGKFDKVLCGTVQNFLFRSFRSCSSHLHIQHYAACTCRQNLSI
jgi:hypothetical protein